MQEQKQTCIVGWIESINKGLGVKHRWFMKSFWATERKWAFHASTKFWRCRTWLRSKKNLTANLWKRASKKCLTTFPLSPGTETTWCWNLWTIHWKTTPNIRWKSVKNEMWTMQLRCVWRFVWSTEKRAKWKNRKCLWATSPWWRIPARLSSTGQSALL